MRGIFTKDEWFSNVRGDVLAGITITLALIPDAIAFSFIAGVNPMIGLFSTVIIMLVISFCGARPAMVSSVAGSMAVLMTPLVLKHGVEYLFAATILAGVIQLLMGTFKTGKWMNFMPKSAVIGFINALAVLVLLDQMKHLIAGDWLMYAVVAATLAIIYVLPLLTKAIPSPLVAVVTMTLVCVGFGLPLKTVGDQAIISTSLPMLGLPDLPMTWDTLLIILPFAISLALVGYTETLLTQTIIDEQTGVRTSKDRELKGQGTANAISGLFGGIAGCALVAESIIHVKLGARGRLSTLVGGALLFVLILLLGQVVSVIPIAALVGIMLMICYEIFDFKSILRVRRKPAMETIIMLVTMIVSVVTHNLAIGALAGVLLSMISFVYKTSRIYIQEETLGDEKIYHVRGALFFASATELQERIKLNDSARMITLDLREARMWDYSSRQTLREIRQQLRSKGFEVRVLQSKAG